MSLGTKNQRNALGTPVGGTPRLITTPQSAAAAAAAAAENTLFERATRAAEHTNALLAYDLDGKRIEKARNRAEEKYNKSVLRDGADSDQAKADKVALDEWETKLTAHENKSPPVV